MTITQTALALVATNIGGGLLGSPFTFYRLGLVLGPIYCFMIAILGQVSTLMYFKTKDLTPKKPESVYEIAYVLFGRPSIFVVTITMFISIYGALVMYYMVIGDTLSTIMISLLTEPENGGKIDLDGYPLWV